jgi:5-methylcytosine-specific restriction enzyme A
MRCIDIHCRNEAVPGRSRCREHLRACICGVVGCRRHRGSSSWARYAAKNPERDAFYRSGAWRAARSQHLAVHPFCATCGDKATIVDHRLNRARGGADLDPGNLQSMCRRCHQRKTVEESHRGNKRAAERRRRGRS